MKRNVKIVGILLMLFIAGSVTLSAQRGMRGMMDSTRMDRMKMGPGYGRMQSGNRPDSMMMKRMKQGMVMDMGRGMGMGMGRMGNRCQFMTPQPLQGMRRGMRHGAGFDMRRGMGQMPMNGRGMRPMGPERMIMESVPNVTEKQKKDIADLRLKQQDEMKKMRDEMMAKMKTIRESQRAKMMDLLTPEQKKFIESKSGNTNPVPATTK